MVKKYLLYFILTIAFLVRFIGLSDFPAGFNADEASFGYDAYSLLHTSRDQWGNLLPIVLKSFGDFKSPVYSYLAIPSVFIFGLNIFSTRLPSVMVGTLAVLVVYLSVNRILKTFKLDNDPILEWLGIIASFLSAVNPWSVMLSRGAAEANLITLFLPLGIYFYLRGLENPRYLTPAAISFGIGLFTYHSAKMITPIVVIGLLLIFRGQLLRIKYKKLLIPAVIFLVMFFGMLYTFKIGGGTRVSERSIAQGALLEGFQERISAVSSGENPRLAKILHNKYQVIVNRFVTNYFQYLSPRFLLNNGAGDASYVMVPGVGTIYLVEAILFLGLFFTFSLNKKFRVLIIFLLVWVAISILPAALSSGGGFAGNRASGMIPVLQILESIGLIGWILLIRKFDIKYKQIIYFIFSFLLFSQIYNFMSTYFKTQSTLTLKQQVFGSYEAANWLKDNTNGRAVLISRSLSEPQIFLAFSHRWDPKSYQDATKSWKFDTSGATWVDQLPSYSLGNYTVKSIDWKTDVNSGSILVSKADEYKGSQIPIKTFNYPDGTPNIYVIDTNQKIYAKVL